MIDIFFDALRRAVYEREHQELSGAAAATRSEHDEPLQPEQEPDNETQ